MGRSSGPSQQSTERGDTLVNACWPLTVHQNDVFGTPKEIGRLPSPLCHGMGERDGPPDAILGAGGGASGTHARCSGSPCAGSGRTPPGRTRWRTGPPSGTCGGARGMLGSWGCPGQEGMLVGVPEVSPPHPYVLWEEEIQYWDRGWFISSGTTRSYLGSITMFSLEKR